MYVRKRFNLQIVSRFDPTWNHFLNSSDVRKPLSYRERSFHVYSNEGSIIIIRNYSRWIRRPRRLFISRVNHV